MSDISKKVDDLIAEYGGMGPGLTDEEIDSLIDDNAPSHLKAPNFSKVPPASQEGNS